MAATPTNFDATKTAIGPGQLWMIPSPPAAGAYLLLAADGTPDSTSGAIPLGSTEAGSTFKDGATFEEYFSDEFVDPIRTSSTGGAATISAVLQQVADMDLLKMLTPGRGTKFTALGKEGITGGSIPIDYFSIALIFPTVADRTKFQVIQLYKCYNSAGIDIAIARKGLAKTAVTFKGLAITSRPATDNTYAAWKMI